MKTGYLFAFWAAASISYAALTPAHAKSSFQPTNCWNGKDNQEILFSSFRTKAFDQTPNYFTLNAFPRSVLGGALHFEPVDSDLNNNSEITDVVIPVDSIADGIYTNENATKTIIDLTKSDFASNLNPQIRYRISGWTDGPIKREFPVLGQNNLIGNRYYFDDSIDLAAVTKLEDVIEQFRNRVFNVGNPDPELEDDVGVLMAELKSPPVGSIPGNAQPSNIKPDPDALVMIRFKKRGSWGTCVGTHIGNGEILTARHCLGDDYYFLFGDIEQDYQPSSKRKDSNLPVVGEYECTHDKSMPKDGILKPSKVIKDGNKLVDVAILKIHSDFLHSENLTASKFKNTKLEYKNQSILGEIPVDHSGPEYFSMATIWPDEQPHDIAWNENGETVQPEPRSKVFFFPDQTKTKAYNCQNSSYQQPLNICAPQFNEKNISQYSWKMGCPTTKRVSGSPIFDAANKDLKIIAVVSAEQSMSGNCAAPIYLDTP